MFADTVGGANASANLYSLVETAKANGIESYRYLVALFKRLPLAQTADDYEALLAQEATQIQTVMVMVESGLGVALVPSVMQRFASQNLVFRRLVDLPDAAAIGLALAYHPERESAAA